MFGFWKNWAKEFENSVKKDLWTKPYEIGRHWGLELQRKYGALAEGGK